jgi:cyclohexadieny/prephenate dehydrogenase
MVDTPLFERITLIGMGLIGSSLAHAIRRGRLAAHVAACDSSDDVLATVERLGLADSTTTSVAEAVRGADLVIVCTPVGTFAAIGEAMRPALAPGAIVSDTGSVKQCVVRDLGPCIPEGVHFVPGHPIAGTEHSGPEAGFAELFDGRWCILTPAEGTDAAAVALVERFWTALGSKAEHMDAQHHDLVLRRRPAHHVRRRHQHACAAAHLVAVQRVQRAPHQRQVQDLQQHHVATHRAE